MCGRFVSLLSPELLKVIYEIFSPPEESARYNVAPTQMVPVVRQDSMDNRTAAPLRWGLIPHWAKDQSIGSRMINARSETVHEKPAFRQAIRCRRCIVPAQGFYEWQATSTGKEPWYISPRDGLPFSLAGIWESWCPPGGEALETFSILTTEANSLMSPIHERMPVILHPTEFSQWLDVSITDPLCLRRLYQPFPPDLMQAWRVSKLVNSPAHDSEECLRKLS